MVGFHICVPFLYRTSNWKFDIMLPRAYFIKMHYNVITMRMMVSQITGVLIVWLNHLSGADQRNHQSSELLALCEGNPPMTGGFPSHKGPVMWKMFPFDDAIMGLTLILAWISYQMPSKVWDGISYPFPNFNSCTLEVLECISYFILHFLMDVITYLCRGYSLIIYP